MAVVTVYQHGLKAGIAPEKSDHVRAKRGRAQGWTQKATRANIEFLQSVYLPEVTGLGFSFTLTVRYCPESSRQWAAMRKAFVQRLERFGCYRLHWVTEWQRRGVPHLHGMIYFPEPLTLYEYTRQVDILENSWLAVCGEYGGASNGQCIRRVDDPVGWLEYLGKHSARGVDHYQRASSSMPDAWQGASGRVWGYRGVWPTKDGLRFDMSQRGFWELRRRMRSYRIADARAAGEKTRRRRITSARTMLRCHEPHRSEVRGVRDWLPIDAQLKLIRWVLSQGHTIVEVVGDEQIDIRSGEVLSYQPRHCLPRVG